MKTKLAFFALLCFLWSPAQVTLKYDKLDPNNKITGDALERKADFSEFTITVTGITDAQSKKLTFHSQEKQLTPAMTMEGSNCIIDLTDEVKNLEHDATIGMRKEGKPVFSFDVTLAQKEEQEESVDCPESGFQAQAQLYFNDVLENYKKQYNIKERNDMYVSDKGVIHLFIDHYGHYYGHTPPTRISPENKFQIHVITSECLTDHYSYTVKPLGKFEVQFNIEKAEAVAQSADGEIIFKLIDLPSFGPFTGEFTYDVVRRKDKTVETIDHQSLVSAKLYHVSIVTGMLATTLRNPQNIETSLMENGNTTLIADDPSVRGVLGLMAIYYPAGRTFLFPQNPNFFDFSRTGIVVGTQLNDNLAENFLLGITQDFARGGALTIGAHFGRRNYMPGMRHFDFGEDEFDGTDITVKKEWNVGLFFGITIDGRVAIELLKSLGSSN